MNKNSPVRRGIKILLWIAGSLVIIAAGLHLFFMFYMNDRIRNDLEQQFSIQTSGNYQLKIRKIRTNIFVQSVQVEKFEITPRQKGTNTKYIVSASSIDLIDFGLINFLLHKDLEFEALKLTQPSVTVFRNNADEINETKDTSHHPFSTYDLLKKYVHSLHVEQIQIENAFIKIYANEKDSLVLLDSRNNSLHVEGLTIDETTKSLGRLFLAKKTDLTLNQFAYTTKDSLYTIKVSKVFASYSDSMVRMDSVRLIPNYTKREFATMKEEQTDRVQISTASIEFKKMDVKLFFEKNWFIAHRLDINGFYLQSYRNKNDFRKPHYPKSIQALIQSVPVYMRIDTVELKKALCEYEEVAEGTTAPGKITFNNIHAVITGVSNRYRSKSDHSLLVFRATCKLMNQAHLSLEYGFPLNTDKVVFNCKGHLRSMPFHELNRMLEPMANVSLVDGQLDSMIFSFRANDIYSEGEMRLAYHGLKVQIRKEDKSANRLLSFLAHSLVIKEENPSGDAPLRITRIYYPRDRDRFLFHYSIKSLLSGIKPAMGLPDRGRK